MAFGPAFQFFSLDSADNVNHYINETASTGLDPETLYSRQVYAGGKYSLIVDTRDNQVLPQKGIYWHTTVQHLIGLNDYSYDVTRLNTDFTFHVSLIPNTLIFANRFGGGHNFGNFEFHQAQYLGNEDNLRGYHKNRFAGRSKIYNNAELRLRLATFQTYLFPAFFGVLAFYDMGKIWDHEGKGSDLLTGYGGGFWFAPLKRLVFTFNFVASKETKLPLIGVGWNF